MMNNIKFNIIFFFFFCAAGAQEIEFTCHAISGRSKYMLKIVKQAKNEKEF